MAFSFRSITLYPIRWSLVAYGVSLVLPAICERRGQGVTSYIYGIQCLIMFPWIAMYPAWYANIFYFSGLVTLARKQGFAAFCCGLISVLLALTTVGIFWREFQRWLTQPAASAIFPLGPGYFMWLISMVILTVGAYRQMPRRPTPQSFVPPSAP